MMWKDKRPMDRSEKIMMLIGGSILFLSGIGLTYSPYPAVCFWVFMVTMVVMFGFGMYKRISYLREKYTGLANYRRLESQLARCRQREEEILEEMDQAWEDLTEEQKEKIEKEPGWHDNLPDRKE